MTITNFSTLQSTHEYLINLELKTPLHIGGASVGLSSSSSPILRNANDIPVLPGSSIKGVMRTASENLLHLIDSSPACFLDGDNGCTKKHKDEIAGILKSEKSGKDSYQRIYNLLCPVCRTYGGGNIASKITFSSVLFEDVKTAVRDGIGIDRRTGTTTHGAKFDYEIIESGIPFTIKIEAENLTEKEEKVFSLALLQLQQNRIRFGGLHARGLGKVEWSSGTVRKTEYEKMDILTLLADKKNVPVSIEVYLKEVFERKTNE